MENNKNKKIIVIVFLFLLMLSVGYALFSQTITIGGTATAKAEFDIIFSKIGSITKSGYTDQSGNDGIGIAQIKDEGKKLEILVDKLNYPGAYVEINATITNKGTIPAKLKEIVTTGLDEEGSPIKVSYIGLNKNDTQFLVGDSKEVTIKVEWDKNINDIAEKVDFSIKLDYEQINPEQITTTSVSSGDIEKIYDVGEEITVGTESFYVIRDNGSSVTALAKYALNVGDYLVPEATVGVQNSQVGIYGEEAYGPVAFSNTKYWEDWDLSGSSFVYDSNSNLYQYVQNYQGYLINTLGKTSVSATLLSAEDAISLGCTWSDGDITNSNVAHCPSSVPWLYSMYYWLGSASPRGPKNIFRMNVYDKGFANDGNFTDMILLRPVITILKNDLN